MEEEERTYQRSGLNKENSENQMKRERRVLVSKHEEHTTP